MFRTVEASIDINGNIQLLQKMKFNFPRRVLVTILDEPAI